MKPRHVVIEETEDVNDARRVELTNATLSLPYARPYDTPAFTEGGAMRHEKVFLDGAPEPIFQLHQADYRELQIVGSFRDRRGGIGFAKGMRDRVEEIRRRGNIVRLIWGDEAWEGLLGETELGREGDGHIGYTIKFEISRGPDVSIDPLPETPRGNEDAIARVRAEFARHAAPPGAVAARVAFAIAVADAAVSQGLRDLHTVIAAAPKDRERTAEDSARVIGFAAAAQSHAGDFLALVQNSAAPDVNADDSQEAREAWEQWRAAITASLSDVESACQATQIEERSRLNQRSVLHRVTAGDTLDSLAQRYYGTDASASRLRLRASDLRVGRTVRIPEAR